MERLKRQFRLFDIYRQAYTGTSSSIRGILYYIVERYNDYTTITVKYWQDDEESYLTRNSEDELRKVVKKVNKRLKNCRKPGKKRRKINVAQ